MAKFTAPIVLLAIVVGLVLFLSSVYTVRETQQVVLTEFGEVVGEPVREPGLHFKVPFIQKPNYFEARLLEWDGDPERMPTRDKRFLFVDTFARWRIADARLYLEKCQGRETRAQARLDDILDGKAREAVRSHDLIEVVRDSARELQEVDADARPAGEILVGRTQIARNILEEAKPVVEDLGIELVDFRFKRINYEAGVRKSVYERMKSERRRIAEEYKSTGKGEAERILGSMEKELRQIESDAYRRVQEIRGTADAQATAIYAAAYGQDAKFYEFWQAMQLLRESVDEDSNIVLTTDGALFEYLESAEGTKD